MIVRMTQNKTLNTQLMKPIVLIRSILVLFAMLCLGEVYSQNVGTPDPVPVDFVPVPGSVLEVRGELKMIANAIVGPNDRLRNEFGNNQNYTPNDDYNGPETNNGKTFGYIDIDGDPSTFSSSSAVLTTSDPSCAEVVYAGLYWGASYYVDRTNSSGSASTGDWARYQNLPLPDNRPAFNTLKLMTPWSGSYIDILPSQTEVLFDGYRNTATNTSNLAIRDMPYACYADITDIFTSAPDNTVFDGTYTVADMRASTGEAADNSAGISGGWVLVVIYEDPALSRKYISTNKGFLEVSNDNNSTRTKSFTYSGFQTLPPPLNVRARYGAATLEGDFDLRGDRLRIRRPNNALFSLRTSPANPVNNFFDSSVSVDGQYVDRPLRIPASRNTLGFDADIFDLDNQPPGGPNNFLIGNNQTSVEFQATSNSDRYRIFMNTFEVEIIAPELRVTKRVLDENLMDITNNNDITLDQQLFYQLTIQNVGNEDVIDATIRDVIPPNVDFTGFSTIEIDPPNSMTYTYDSVAREFNITLNESFIERYDGEISMRFGVDVVASCEDLRDACSNEIANLAFATYRGEESLGDPTTGEPSVLGPDACNFNVAGASVFLVDLGLCDGIIDDFLCTGTLPLTAGGGFANYVWTDITNGSPGPVIGNTQTITVSAAGTYRVDKTDPVCADAFEIRVVTTLSDIANPVLDIVNNLPANGNVSGTIEECSITGNDFPELFLCGAGTTIDLNTGFVATSITWERLDPAACPGVTRVDNCPTVDAACDPSWTQVGTGASFTLSEAGEYRITAVFDNNCPRTFYFNAYQNNFDPTLAITREIICGLPGALTVQNSSNQYEYQLVTPSGALLPNNPTDDPDGDGFQDSADFDGLTEEGNYTVNVRQNNGQPTACVFQAQRLMENQESTVEALPVNPACPGDTGQININVTDSQPNYIYNISSTEPGNTYSDSEGPTTDTSHSFIGLQPGGYSVEILSYDEDGVGPRIGCIDTVPVTVAAPPTFDPSAVLNRDLACNPDYQPDPSLPFFDDDEFIALIEINVTGGSGNFGYFADSGSGFVPLTLNPQTPPVTNIFRVNAAGSYLIAVTDTDTGCTINAETILVTPFEALDGSAAPSTRVCPSDPGAVVVTLTAGEGDFTYVLNQGTATEVTFGPTPNTSHTFNGVDVTATHSVIVTDRFGCDITFDNIQFPVIQAITADVGFTDYSCDAAGTGETLAVITISNPQNGNGSYEYSIDGVNFVGTNTFGGLRDGTYTLYIRDTATGACPVTLTPQVVIDPLQRVTDLDFALIAPPITCPTLTANVQVTPTGNVGTDVEYQITAPITRPWQGSTFTNLPEDATYTFQARSTIDGCIYEETFTIDPIDKIAVVGNLVSDPICAGDADGALSFTVSGVDLTSTTYSYTVTGGTITTAVPPFANTGQTAATITVPGIGVNPPTGATSLYTITVTDDSTGCDITDTVTITNPAPIVIIPTPQIADCSAANGQIAVSATGGRGGYQYELRDSGGAVLVPYQSTALFTGLVGGTPPTPITYIVAVRDGSDPATACEETINVDLEQAPPITIAAVPGGDACYTNADPATQWVTITGGVAAYEYSLDGGTFLPVDFTTPATLPANTFEIPNLTPRNAGTPPNTNYSVVVRDVNGCTSPVITFEIQDELTLNAALLKDLDCTPGDNDATIEITTTGGNGAVTLTVDFNGTGPVAVPGPFPVTYRASVAGTYVFEVTDSASPTRCTASDTVIVTDNPPPTADVDPTDIRCNGDATGIITFSNLASGTPPYQTSIDNGVTFSSQLVYSGLTANTYDYVVIDSKGCRLTGQVDVDEPLPLTASVTADPITCVGAGAFDWSDVTVNITSPGTPGVTGYRYRIYDNATNALVPTGGVPPAPVLATNDATTALTTFVFSELNFGTYYVTVEDENTCLFRSDPFTINSQPDDLDFDVVDVASDCSATGAVYDILISEGARPYQIRIVDVPGFDVFTPTNGTIDPTTPVPPAPFVLDATVGGNVHQFSGLTFSVPYIVEVIDGGGCVYREALAPQAAPNGVTVAETGKTDVLCNGETAGLRAGTISFTFDGYAGNDVQWEIFNASSGIPIGSGSASPGPAPYSSTLGDFGAGSYLVVFSTPAEPFCGASLEFDIDEPAPLELEFVSQTPQLCDIMGMPRLGSITVVATGGTGPYSYGLSAAGPFTDADGTLELAASGTAYTVFVEDAQGCTAGPITRTVVSIPGPTFDTPLPTFVDDPCDFDNVYTFTVTVSDGVGQLEYGVDDGDPVTADIVSYVPDIPNDRSFEFTVNGPGDYTYYVKDENGCIDTGTITVYPELIIDANFIAPPPTCRDADGTIEVTVTGGSDFATNFANFSFTLVGTDSNGNPVNRTQGGLATDNVFTLVSSGTYTVTVRDLTIGPNPPAPGGCTASDDVSRPIPDLPVLDPPTIVDVRCVGDSNGSILVNLQAGTDTDGPFTYELWIGPTGSAPTLPAVSQLDDPLFTGLADISGNPAPNNVYGIVVRSNTGCEVRQEGITVDSPPAFTADRTLIDYVCNASNVPQLPDIQVDITGIGTPPYRISYTGPLSAANIPFAGAQYIINADVAGTYTGITVQDANNCTVNLADVIVPAFPELSNPMINVGAPISCNNEVQEITITVTGGTPGDVLNFVELSGTVPAQNGIAQGGATTTSGTFTMPGLPAGANYIFEITDVGTGCSIRTEYRVPMYDMLEATITLGNDITCFNTPADGSVVLTVSGYTGAYDYVATVAPSGTTVSGSGNTATPETIPGLPEGLVTVEVTATPPLSPLPPSTCTDISNSIPIAPAPVISASINPLNPETCVPGGDATVEVVASGGTGALQYQLQTAGGVTILVPFGTDPTFGGFGLDGGVAPAGIDYEILVQDTRSCVVTLPFNIQPPNPITVASPPVVALDCSDSTNGQIVATVTGGQGVGLYQFTLTLPDGSVSGPVTSTTNVYTWSDLPPNNNADYIVTVSDNLNCGDTANVRITAPDPVTVNVLASGESCNTPNPNTITVSGNGGTPGYTYFYINTSGTEVAGTGAGGDEFNGLAEGDYQFYARDSRGCTSEASNNIQVRLPEPFMATLDESNFMIVCFGENTGSVDAAVSGGLGNYQYRVEGVDYLGAAVTLPGPLATDTQDTSFFGGLLANAPTGNYTYIVTSEDCTEIRLDFQITQPPLFEALAFEEPISCNGETDGSIRVTATGGTAPYFYSLYDSNDNVVIAPFIEDDVDELPGEHTFEDLPADTYRVEVEDSNGCPFTILDIIIIEPAAIEATTISTTAEECAGDMNGTANISITGGLAPSDPADPAYFWSRDGITYIAVADPTNLFIDMLAGGTNTIFIRDSQNNVNCELAYPIEIEPGVDLQGTLEQRLDCPVYDYTDPLNPVMTSEEVYYIDFDVNAESEALDVIYTINGVNGTPNPANNISMERTFQVEPGQYEGIMQYLGCEVPLGTITIEEYTPLTIPVPVMTGNPQDPNEYEITVTGGTQLPDEPFYTFLVGILEDGQTIDQVTYDIAVNGNVFTIRETATYVLRVIDARGCEIIGTYDLTYINIRIPNYFTPGVDRPETPDDDSYWYPRQILPPGTTTDPFFFENMEVMVFDRYGRMLAEFRGNEKGWDGLYQGKQLPSGDYWFTIILNDVDNREFTGHFTLYR